ncbi:MAG: GNAT family N-acetyltransferase [Steroidobacteraceae bacterium]
MDVLVRPESPQDEAAIEAVTRAAFLAAPHTSHTEQFIVAALRRAGALAVSLVAVEAGTVIGHVAASPVVLSDGARGWHGLGPIAVLPAHQGQGIGSRLVREALGALRARGAAGCVVLGEPAFYGRFGFRAETDLVLPDVPPEYFQALAFGGPLPRGVVSFHAAFDARA